MNKSKEEIKKELLEVINRSWTFDSIWKYIEPLLKSQSPYPRWVKASERLPENGQKVIARQVNKQVHEFTFWKQLSKSWKVNIIEWLDEQSPINGVEEKIKIASDAWDAAVAFLSDPFDTDNKEQYLQSLI